MAEGRIIIFAGAPEAHDLSWESSNLTDALQTPVKRFIYDDGSAPRPLSAELSTTIPKWRSVAVDCHEATGGQAVREDFSATQFLAFDHDLGAAEDDERLQFLQESLLQLNELESSGIADMDETSLYPSTLSLVNATYTTSFDSTANTSLASNGMPVGHQIIRGDDNSAQSNIKSANEITDLKRIPPAFHLTRIHPQTLTVTILAAVISISAPRTVGLRRQPGKEMDIIELLFGDETRAGFSVSFWLVPAESQSKPVDDLRDQVLSLRSGDVVLVRNVALRDWNGCVYGQTLSRRFARNSTSVMVVDDDAEMRMGREVRGKAERVQGWSWEFIGRRKGIFTTMGTAEEGTEVLPPDTQSPLKR